MNIISVINIKRGSASLTLVEAHLFKIINPGEASLTLVEARLFKIIGYS